jgi:N-acetylmuramoyl-L-alanine amidase
MSKQPSRIDLIVVHHSASHPETTVEEITKWHLERGFSQIGYHSIITNEGIIHHGRPESLIPASVKDHNRGTLAVCLTGNFERDIPTPYQLIGLQLQIQEWKMKFPNAKVVGHRQLGATLCPGQNLYNWLQEKYPRG